MKVPYSMVGPGPDSLTTVWCPNLMQSMVGKSKYGINDFCQISGFGLDWIFLTWRIWICIKYFGLKDLYLYFYIAGFIYGPNIGRKSVTVL